MWHICLPKCFVFFLLEKKNNFSTGEEHHISFRTPFIQINEKFCHNTSVNLIFCSRNSTIFFLKLLIIRVSLHKLKENKLLEILCIRFKSQKSLFILIIVSILTISNFEEFALFLTLLSVYFYLLQIITSLLQTNYIRTVCFLHPCGRN